MEYTEEFETFFTKYPKRWNSNLHCWVKRKKWPAFESWRKLSPELHAEILAKASMIRRSEGTPRDAVTWLNQKGWDDIELPEPKKPFPKELMPAIKSVPSTKVNVSDAQNRQKNKLRMLF